MRLVILGIVFSLFSMVHTVHGQAVPSTDYLCDDGTLLTNVTTLRFNYRQGEYTVSVIGIGDFDPVLAIVDATERELSCADNSPDFNYTLDLPSSGQVESSENSIQTVFTVSGANFMDVYFYVGNANETGGEFLVMFEDIRYTFSDLIGDNLYISYTEEVARSSIPVTIYMIDIDYQLDTIIYAVTATNKPITLDGEAIACDDAGTYVCYGDDVPLETYELEIPTPFSPDPYTSMLVLPRDIAEQILTSAGNIKLVLGSYARDSEGRYIAIVHIGVADPEN